MALLEHTGNDIWIKGCYSCKTEFKVTADKYPQAEELMTKFFCFNTANGDGFQTKCRSCQCDNRHGRTTKLHRDVMLALQEGKCGICDKEISFSDRSAFVDHDHVTHITRKVLCNRCNMWMAGIDNEEWLKKAISYRDGFRG